MILTCRLRLAKHSGINEETEQKRPRGVVAGVFLPLRWESLDAWNVQFVQVVHGRTARPTKDVHGVVPDNAHVAVPRDGTDPVRSEE